MSKRKNTNNKQWFKKVRGSYLPSSWQGWLTYIPYLAFLIASFVAVDKGSHSASDTIIGIFPYWVCAAVVMQWFASQNSR